MDNGHFVKLLESVRVAMLKRKAVALRSAYECKPGEDVEYRQEAETLTSAIASVQQAIATLVK